VFYICIGTVVKFILDSFINNKQIKKTHNMEKKIFTSKESTKEQYLKFKEFIKSDAYKDHSDYVAYYIFKHRIEGEERDKYLEDEIRHRCWKMLYSGRWGVSGGEMTESYVVPAFKNRVITTYNKYASTDGEE
jgi:hypothetical protein